MASLVSDLATMSGCSETLIEVVTVAELITAPLLAQRVLGAISDSFVIAEWRDAGGAPGPPRYIAPLHLHHHDDEAWYVLEGVLRVKSG